MGTAIFVPKIPQLCLAAIPCNASWKGEQLRSSSTQRGCDGYTIRNTRVLKQALKSDNIIATEMINNATNPTR